MPVRVASVSMSLVLIVAVTAPVVRASTVFAWATVIVASERVIASLPNPATDPAVFAA